MANKDLVIFHLYQEVPVLLKSAGLASLKMISEPVKYNFFKELVFFEI